MSEPIKVGDLVMVVRPCCAKHLGKIATAMRIGTPRSNGCGRWECSCHHVREESTVTVNMDFGKGDGWMPIDMLKRIPPLWELDDVKRDEEITA